MEFTSCTRVILYEYNIKILICIYTLDWFTFAGSAAPGDDSGSALSSFCSWLGVVASCVVCWCDVPADAGCTVPVAVVAVVVVDVAAAEAGGDGIGAGAYCMQPELVDEDGDAGGEPWLDDG